MHDIPVLSISLLLKKVNSLLYYKKMFDFFILDIIVKLFVRVNTFSTVLITDINIEGFKLKNYS